MTPAAQGCLRTLLAAAGFLVLVAWAWDDLSDWLRPFIQRAVYTSGIQPPLARCTLPT